MSWPVETQAKQKHGQIPIFIDGDLDLPREFLVSPTLEFVIVGLVVRLLRRVKDGLPN